MLRPPVSSRGQTTTGCRQAETAAQGEQSGKPSLSLGVGHLTIPMSRQAASFGYGRGCRRIDHALFSGETGAVLALWKRPRARARRRESGPGVALAPLKYREKVFDEPEILDELYPMSHNHYTPYALSRCLIEPELSLFYNLFNLI